MTKKLGIQHHKKLFPVFQRPDSLFAFILFNIRAFERSVLQYQRSVGP